MIKYLKVGNSIYRNMQEQDIVPVEFDENGEPIKFEEQWNIPTDIEKLRSIVIDTINWLIGNEIKKIAETDAKLSASNSKAILLLYKMLRDQCDTANLTDKEKAILEKYDELLAMNYTDSELLLTVSQQLIDSLKKYAEYLTQAEQATTFEELLEILRAL